MMNDMQEVTAFAPATSANVAVGFDVLGFAVAHLGDEVKLVKSKDQKVEIASIAAIEPLPYDLQKNTATVALQAMLHYLNLKQGFKVFIKKNIPLSSGLGGSAACSVAAVVALNRFLTKPLSMERLIEFALVGEETACGAKHGDNVIPSLLGGMTLVCSLTPLNVIQVPLIPLHIVLLHPHMQLDTRKARSVLPATVSLSLASKQNARLAAFISAFYEKNYERLSQACVDELIEPLRAPLIPHFYALKEAAYQNGALACSISGSGPTLFAFASSKKQAELIGCEMSLILKNHGIESDVLVTTISSQGAVITDESLDEKY